MFNIKEYLDKFKNIGLSNKENKEIILATVFDLLKIKLEKESFEIKEGVVVFKTSAVIKNSIYIKKTTLISELNKKGVKIYEIR